MTEKGKIPLFSHPQQNGPLPKNINIKGLDKRSILNETEKQPFPEISLLKTTHQSCYNHP